MLTLKKIEKEAVKLTQQEKLDLIDTLIHDLREPKKKNRVSIRGLFKGTNITDKDLEEVKKIWE